MKLMTSLIFLSLFSSKILAQQNEPLLEIDRLCSTLETDSRCQNEITIDSSTLSSNPYVIKFYRSNKNERLVFVHYQLLKPFVSLKYFYYQEKLIKVTGIDKSTAIILKSNLYFENGNLIHSTHRSVDGDNSVKYFLNKSKEYLLFFLLNNKAL